MDLKNIHQSKLIKGILIGITIAVVVITIFEAGVFVGFRKSSFACKLGENYYRALRGGKPMAIMGMDNDNIPGGHGATGKIVKITLPTLMVADDDNVEKTVIISSSTMIKRFDQTITASDIKQDEYAVVLGSPDSSSRINARFIRILPPPQNIESSTN